MKLIYMTFVIAMVGNNSFAQPQRKSLEEISTEMNKALPEVYDQVTKLMRTTVENNNINYHFLIDADKKDFAWALPKVRSQILSNVCKNVRQKTILTSYRANIVYSYENVKGQALGEFMVKTDQCQ